MWSSHYLQILENNTLTFQNALYGHFLILTELNSCFKETISKLNNGLIISKSQELREICIRLENIVESFSKKSKPI